LVLNDREDGDKTDYLKAIKCYNTAIDLEPENAQFYFNKGISYHMLCRFNNEKSKKEFKQAIKCKVFFIICFNILYLFSCN